MVGDDDGVRPVVGGPQGVVGVEDALEDELAPPLVAHPREVVPRHTGVELRVDPAPEGVRGAGPRHGPLEVGEREGSPAQRHVPHPGRVRGEVPCPHEALRQGHGVGHAVAGVAIAGADHGEVDCEDEHRAPRSARPTHEVLGVAAVAHDVELEPERPCGGSPHLLDAADRHRGLAEGDAGSLGGTGGLYFGAPGEHPREADRSEDQRQGEILTEHRRTQSEVRDVPEHPLAEPDTTQVRDVGAHRGLLVSAPVEVVEELAGQAAARQFPVVTDGRGGEPQGAVAGSHAGIVGPEGPQSPRGGMLRAAEARL